MQLYNSLKNKGLIFQALYIVHMEHINLYFLRLSYNVAILHDRTHVCLKVGLDIISCYLIYT